MARLVLIVLSTALVLAQPAMAAGPWRQLHRPLHLPSLAAGKPCPISRIDRRVDWPLARIFGGSGIGRGPAYPGLGASGGTFTTRSDSSDAPWFGGKIFWYVSPSYRGRVLVRGRRLDSAGPLAFKVVRSRRAAHQGSDIARELRIAPGDTVTWRGQPRGSRGLPSDVLIRASGCYGVQIDGATFSRTVVFAASIP